MEVRRGHLDPLNLELQDHCKLPCGCCELNPGPLVDQPVEALGEVTILHIFWAHSLYTWKGPLLWPGCHTGNPPMSKGRERLLSRSMAPVSCLQPPSGRWSHPPGGRPVQGCSVNSMECIPGHLGGSTSAGCVSRWGWAQDLLLMTQFGQLDSVPAGKLQALASQKSNNTPAPSGCSRGNSGF